MPVIALSVKKMKSLTCPEGSSKQNFHDSQCKGLTLEVRSSGGRTWYFRYRDTYGRQHQLRLGDATDINLDQARQKADQFRGQVAMGQDPNEQRRTRHQIPTLNGFIQERYIPYVQSYKRSWQTDECLLRNHVLPSLGSRPMDQITKGDIISLIQAHRQTHKPASSNRVLVMLRYIFNLAMEWETAGVSKNPTVGVPLYKENNKRERYLTAEETQRLFRELERSQNPMLRFIIPMLILTGARKSEVLKARWDEFDFGSRIWRIGETKGGQARHVPISDALFKLLDQIGTQRKSRWLFPHPETGEPLGNFFNSWNTARKRADLSDVRIHDLRHSFASMLVNSGHSLYEVQKLLGHTQIRTTQRYAHLDQGTLLRASNQVGRIVYGSSPSAPSR
ncbi:site-specific integrase [Ectothiorhodospira haloalkaliphila]|uniref:tyrosine-type recombinase/integrase n=1 Tax=Ectothiorhodospira haloalkaliphila TaxID=421628 RepID=UPI001EE93AAE|nr:site-specific integrase [Ectothiorhodospira haloalkaliphila]MCG5526379.1 site-specific integrase [Ectothiorhodospira haloalkaliphila]